MTLETEKALRGEIKRLHSLLRQVRQEETARINAGFQCPECYGVRIETRTTRFDASPNGFLCTECGCQWGQR